MHGAERVSEYLSFQHTGNCWRRQDPHHEAL